MIKINDDWGIKITEISVDVYKKEFNKKKNEEYFRAKYYYPSLESALKGMIDRSMGDCTSLSAVVDHINDLKQSIDNYLKKACSEAAG